MIKFEFLLNVTFDTVQINGYFHGRMLARFKSHPRKFPEHFACGGCPAIHFHKALEITGPIVSEGSTAMRSVWLVLIARRIDRFRAHSRSRIDVKTHTCAEYIRNWHTRSPPGIWRARSPFSVPGEKKRGGCGACSKSPPPLPLCTTRVSLASFSLPLSRSFCLS